MTLNPWNSASIWIALRGGSFIDTNHIHINSLEEASDYLESYGFSVKDTNDLLELEKIRLEAIDFLMHELLDKTEKIPAQVINERDVRQLLLNASGHGLKRSRPWSGAVLRVMHTLVHCNSHLNEIYHDEIRNQIMSRFNPHILSNAEGTFLGDIRLYKFEQRITKSRFSVAMKLMHKSENVAADIFDWIGLRFITVYRSDVLDILAYLRMNNIITYANIKPSRSRNTLLDLEWIDEMLAKGYPLEEIKIRMQELGYPSEEKSLSDNPFSEASYHSIQLTCRQRIKIVDPMGERICFYFPFELQLMDFESYLKTREGFASHHDYKLRQKDVVRQRVLPFLYNRRAT